MIIKKAIPIIHIILSIMLLGICHFHFLARRTYFRSLWGKVEEDQYHLAVQAGERMAADIYYPALALFLMGVGLAIYVLIIDKKQNKCRERGRYRRLRP